MAFIQVAVPVPLRQLFTYTHDSALEAGVRVMVPFGPRKLVGVVVETLRKSESEIDNSNKLKAIEMVLDHQPIVDGVLLKMAQWLWQYYHHAPGEVLHAMLPVLLRKGESAGPTPQDMLMLTDEGKKTLSASLSRAPKQNACFTALTKRAMLAIEARKQFGAPAVKALVEKSLAVIKEVTPEFKPGAWLSTCLLYTSDAADE